MIKPTIYTWIIAIFSATTFLPLLTAQFLMILNPEDRKTKNLIIGKGQDWRDKSHFKSALAFAWADLLILLPLLILGNIGVLSGEQWGYILWFALGVLAIYFSIIFWVQEKEYTCSIVGAFAYYTYYWGFFLYWGVAASAFSMAKIF